MNKRLITIISSIFIVIILAFGIFVSYGYFHTSVFNNETSVKGTYRYKSLKAVYSDGTETLNSSNGSFIPGTTLEKKFTITNTGDDKFVYDMILTDLINEFKRPADIVYELYFNGYVIERSTFPTTNNQAIASNIEIEKNEVQNYLLKIRYDSASENQIANSGSKISAKISMRQPEREITKFNIKGVSFWNGDYLSIGDTGNITLKFKKNEIKNGFGEFKNNTNFESLTYSSNRASGASTGTFNFNENTLKKYELGELIPINSYNEYYKIRMIIKNTGNLNTKYNIGLQYYDIDKKIILPEHTTFVKESTIYLTEDLNPGDTEIKVNDSSKYNVSLENKGIIVWNYKDSFGNMYEKGTYSRNVYKDIIASSEFGKLILNSAWNGEKIPAGTYISQVNSNPKSFYYGLCDQCTIPGDKYKEFFSYVGTPISNYYGGRYFAAGTQYIRLYIDNGGQEDEYINSSLSIGEITFIREYLTVSYELDFKNIKGLACVGDVCDYIDVLNSKIVRMVNNGAVLSSPTYENIDLPKISLSPGLYLHMKDEDSLSTTVNNIEIEYE